MHVGVGAGAIHTLTSPPEDLDPPAQARKFIQAFKSAYGDRHPRFVESAFRQAVTQAKNEFKFALVYLHSSEHQVGDTWYNLPSRVLRVLCYCRFNGSIRLPGDVSYLLVLAL